ncbi:DEHA2E09394p [Debaryomyces hansenii CBS767]|uniref:DEHA2E09394p n=1 Tax=Debaryomyces hansenii (strain ATCC 36239 / CBS 767 / BCRC 21394 / JCM 1990 / NBRC 0083 / IGC 2968) TaxID=284592 RepID=B5RTY2_DEBHA|nr:DEHA2E09394p [Debaryomyces hansenii CBS767]CAR65794.1 DEHA2E09394p [Debaryomyces hansenii CBS767]|eukprot:XP_002770451.1 DEHA2E09394p [Debaryomyces hansenii CBS767]
MQQQYKIVDPALFHPCIGSYTKYHKLINIDPVKLSNR